VDVSKPTPIHPAVRKLLGKTVRAADVHSLLSEPSSSLTASHRRYQRQHARSCTSASSVKVSSVHVMCIRSI